MVTEITEVLKCVVERSEESARIFLVVSLPEGGKAQIDLKDDTSQAIAVNVAATMKKWERLTLGRHLVDFFERRAVEQNLIKWNLAEE